MGKAYYLHYGAVGVVTSLMSRSYLYTVSFVCTGTSAILCSSTLIELFPVLTYSTRSEKEVHVYQLLDYSRSFTFCILHSHNITHFFPRSIFMELNRVKLSYFGFIFTYFYFLDLTLAVEVICSFNLDHRVTLKKNRRMGH